MSRVSSNVRNAAVLVALLLGATTGGASAQDNSVQTGASARPSGTTSTTATVARKAAPAPTAAEQVGIARSAVQRGSVLAQRISAMLEEARREADIIRVTCLNDKLTQVNANMRTAQTRMTAFETAADPETRNHEATVLGVLGQKFTILDQEANRCVGQDIYDTGSTKVQTEIDTAKLPFEEDVTTPTPPPPSAIPELPPFMSGTK
jgi:hypothetical protein